MLPNVRYRYNRWKINAFTIFFFSDILLGCNHQLLLSTIKIKFLYRSYVLSFLHGKETALRRHYLEQKRFQNAFRICIGYRNNTLRVYALSQARLTFIAKIQKKKNTRQFTLYHKNRDDVINRFLKFSFSFFLFVFFHSNYFSTTFLYVSRIF